MLHLILQWSGAVTAVTGSYLTGSQERRLRQGGFALYLVSNALWIADALHTQTWGLLAMNAAFTLTSLRGVWTNRSTARLGT
jgi:hypothetical protein